MMDLPRFLLRVTIFLSYLAIASGSPARRGTSADNDDTSVLERRASPSPECRPFYTRFDSPSAIRPPTPTRDSKNHGGNQDGILFFNPPFSDSGSKTEPASSDPNPESGSNLFAPVSPRGSYAVGQGGLELYLDKPSVYKKGKYKTQKGVNEVVAEGATINSTLAFTYGKLTVEMSAPAVSGVVTAAILIAEQDGHRDEIDIELLGGDPRHWQTNVFTRNGDGKKDNKNGDGDDEEPMYGVLSGVDVYPEGDGDGKADRTVGGVHQYSIDWNADRIVWSVDGEVTRTLEREMTRIHKKYHYPNHSLRVQLGIWDASNPLGTSQWAKGPINWDEAPGRMRAVVRSVRVECPY